MEVALTIPINTDAGDWITEFYVVLDVFVSTPAQPRTYNCPGHGPEFEIDSIQVELGTWKVPPNKMGKPKFVSAPHPLPDRLKPFVDDYIASKEGQSAIVEQIIDARLDEL